MYVCSCVTVCVCAAVAMCVRLYVCLYVCTCLSLSVCVYLYVCVRLSVCLHAQACVSVCLWVGLCICVSVYQCVIQACVQTFLLSLITIWEKKKKRPVCSYRRGKVPCFLSSRHSRKGLEASSPTSLKAQLLHPTLSARLPHLIRMHFCRRAHQS